MCVVLQHDLGKGDAALSRCIPLGCGALRGIEPLPAPLKRFAVSSLARGAFLLLLHPHEQRETSLSLVQSLRPTLRGLDAANSSTC